MGISADTQKAIDHYQAVKDLIGAEDMAHIKTFLDWIDASVQLPEGDAVMQGYGVLVDILDPTGIAEQDEGFFDGEIDWEATARKAGWTEGVDEHGPVLIHEEQDRLWPIGDWRGAVGDLGFDATDDDWREDIVYKTV